MELRIENLSKRYPNGVQALRDVSLNIPQGMFGLLGPNGAGKSTLMRTLATLQEADSGQASLDGLDVLRQKDRVRKVLGYLPQEFGVYPKVSAEVLLSHFAALKGIENAKERREVVRALLQQTNLYEHRNKPLGGFSGGMKQRFGIAQALLGNPRLIIVDEPTAGLDPEERVRFHNLLSAIGENIIVILNPHRFRCQRPVRTHGHYQSRASAGHRRTGCAGERTARQGLEEDHSLVGVGRPSRTLSGHSDAPVCRANIDSRLGRQPTGQRIYTRYPRS